MSGIKVPEEMSTTTPLIQAPPLGSSQPSGSLELTQADLYNYLYRQNEVKPLTEDEMRKETRTLTQVYWCTVCKKESPSLCILHGAQHCKPKPPTDSTSAAIKSFPNEVQLCRSSIPGTRFGVVTKCFIPKGTWLGPYEGTKVRPEGVRLGNEATFMWEIYQSGRLVYYLDGSNEETSSWMRFIACARNSSEQNLYAFQYCGNIYYRAFKEIHPGTELLVWYDDNYPQFMGIPLEIRETEGVYQRAGHSTTKQDQVVVVVSDKKGELQTTQPTPPPAAIEEVRAIPYKRLPPMTASSADDDTGSNPLQDLFASDPLPEAAYPLSRKPETSTSELLLRRQKSLPSRTSTGLRSRQSTSEQEFQPNSETNSPSKVPQRLDTGMASDNRKRAHSESSSDTAWGSDERTTSPKENNAFKCGQCGKTFPQRSVLQIHVCPKQPYKPYHCGHCNRLFDDPNELRNHAMIHTNEKPFKCGYCSRSFSGATTLNNHIRTHTGEKPFECRLCGKTFSQASQLSRHEKIPGDCID